MKIVALLKYHYETRPIVDDLIARMREFAAGHEFVVCEDVESFKREIARRGRDVRVSDHARRFSRARGG